MIDTEWASGEVEAPKKRVLGFSAESRSLCVYWLLEFTDS